MASMQFGQTVIDSRFDWLSYLFAFSKLVTEPNFLSTSSGRFCITCKVKKYFHLNLKGYISKKRQNFIKFIII